MPPSLPSVLVTLCLAVLLTSLGCGPIAPEPPSLALQRQALETDNGLTLNGLSANGLSTNGLSTNGLSTNGFAAWFSQAPAQSDLVMRYIVRCAVPAGEVRTYTDAQTQVSYTWSGALGLAPTWASGEAATLDEQQLVSACLAAHANKFGVSVPISVLGQDATGQFIPFSEEELHHYSRKEACFFGNLFNGEGIFFGVDGPRLKDNESSPRQCELSSMDPELRNDCPPLTYAGKCKQLCQRVHGEKFYLECSWGGVAYKPLTTRVSRGAVYSCGDGICQFTESCGRGKHFNSCEKDCGLCPEDEA